ncbi:MAG: ParA-like ATPase [Thermodesulfobacterium sp.]|uniref:ParA-like ATPase n=1 Tax=Candidatus Thermodesulfobacterium syntrophicum TaxID=3060442 RepID=A0AAE3P589_9BACT|nr:ParA-like ATPase [Candidatus Thermodesulfobacterium syntrophicum]
MSVRIITFANKKGGSGKTTTVVNLAAALGNKGKKCLVVDLDPQCHATLISGLNPYSPLKGAGSLFNNYHIENLIKTPSHKLFDIIPSFHKDNSYILYGSELKYKDIFSEISSKYDFILIDTPPGREDILTFCLSVSTELMVPMPLQFLAMEGLAQLLGLLYTISEKYNPNIILSGIIPVMVDMRTKHANAILKELKDTFGNDVIKRGIRIDIKISEAAWHQLPIILYAPRSKAAYDFHMLAEELLLGV